MSDLARLKIWDDPAIRDSLSWYLDVAENRRPAKFRIAATLATQIDPAGVSEDALWAELDRLTPIFLGRWQAIRAGAPLPAMADGPSLLEICRELAYRMLTHCNFCPWNCRVDRRASRLEFIFGGIHNRAGYGGRHASYRPNPGGPPLLLSALRSALCGDVFAAVEER